LLFFGRGKMGIGGWGFIKYILLLTVLFLKYTLYIKSGGGETKREKNIIL
jgi:hypothetical protein